MSDPVEYLRISEGEPFPDITTHAPFRAVVVIEAGMTSIREDRVADWLVGGGCLFMLAWGEGCSSFHDAVDLANIRQFPDSEIPDENFVMTTWHERQTLDDVFWEAQFVAYHGDVELHSSLIVHIGDEDRRDELLTRFAVAHDQPCD